uniref:Uncharacterized protein n=1 Tax=Cucumis sativus TaxID=3659 RepID=A0A0A0KZ52_CUCSA
MASNNVLCKLIMLILVTIIFASNNVATRNLLSMPHLANVKRDEINNPPQTADDEPWDGNIRV